MQYAMFNYSSHPSEKFLILPFAQLLLSFEHEKCILENFTFRVKWKCVNSTSKKFKLKLKVHQMNGLQTKTIENKLNDMRHEVKTIAAFFVYLKRIRFWLRISYYLIWFRILGWLWNEFDMKHIQWKISF